MMQIAMKPVDCICVMCKSMKENNPPKSKSNNGTPETLKTTLPTGRLPHLKNSTRSRQSGKYKPRCLHGSHQQHRLDHTYAAAVNCLGETTGLHPPKAAGVKENSRKALQQTQSNHLVDEKQQQPSPLKTTDQWITLSAGITSNEDELSLKSNWLRNLCLEYQPAGKSPGKTRDDETICLDVEIGRFAENVTPKRYQRNRELNKGKVEQSPTIGKEPDRSTPEDVRRWNAALALIELSRSE